jgi:hypothetical protein
MKRVEKRALYYLPPQIAFPLGVGFTTTTTRAESYNQSF